MKTYLLFNDTAWRSLATFVTWNKLIFQQNSNEILEVQNQKHFILFNSEFQDMLVFYIRFFDLKRHIVAAKSFILSGITEKHKHARSKLKLIQAIEGLSEIYVDG